MKEYKREYVQFSLCGLNCGLCPRYQVSGSSKCPGCGGPEFHLKHPTCPVVTCNKKHDNVEFCFQCSDYPCAKYAKPSEKDSFITYIKVLTDFQKARDGGIDNYISELNEKVDILEYLLDQYNDGRRKNYYCIAVNLLGIEELREIMDYVKTNIDTNEMERKDKIQAVINIFEEKALNKKIQLSLRQ